MLKIITSLAMFLAGLAAQAQTEERSVQPFTKIEMSGTIELIYTEGTEATLRVESDTEENLANLLTEVRGNTLKISRAGNADFPAKVYIEGCALESVKASGASKIAVTNQISTPEITISLSEGSRFSGNVLTEGIINLKAKSGSVFNIRTKSKKLNGKFRDGSKINLSGTSDTASLFASDRAFCNARNFTTDKVEITASTEANVLVHAGDEIVVTASEMAKVTYYGKPERVSLSHEILSSMNNKEGEMITAN
ncbi:MAG: DUF2807 domain-containing protein [Flavobacterium sp.]|nr:MAG: DUF2807 domain-containing protein [Flavobacterium sp.]